MLYIIIFFIVLSSYSYYRNLLRWQTNGLYDKIMISEVKVFMKNIENAKRLPTIIHVDLDAFYASVEERDNPRLKGKPVIVGGRSNKGVVTTANYEARKYGVHSAMPMFMARRKCPKGIYVPGRMERYQEVSREIFRILHSFSDVLEKVSIDEAYLDITHLEAEPHKLVFELKETVYKETGLTLSVGIAYNKFLAKLASDWHKPAGVKEITPEMVPEILLPLPIRKVHGLGPKSCGLLNNLGLYTIGDLLELPEEFLMELLGKSGREVYHRIRGIDPRPVNTHRERKSLGIERTFPKGTRNRQVLEEYLQNFSQELSRDLKEKKLHARTITLKIKDENFKVQSRGKTLFQHINGADEIFEVVHGIFQELALEVPLRLIGITASNLLSEDLQQLSFFDL